jgi:hypothetical protein
LRGSGVDGIEADALERDDNESVPTVDIYANTDLDTTALYSNCLPAKAIVKNIMTRRAITGMRHGRGISSAECRVGATENPRTDFGK